MSYQMFLTPINLVRGIYRIIVVCIGNNSFKNIVSDFLLRVIFSLFYLGGAPHKTSGPVCTLPFRLN